MSYIVTDENMENSDNPKNLTEQVSTQKGGLRTIPFIIVNESFERVASTGIMPNMILYLINGYHMNMATGTTILSLWGSLSDFLSLVGAFISDSYLGRFRVITIGSCMGLLGMTLLWLTAMIPQAKPSPCISSHTDCQSSTFAQLALLLSSFGLISVGAGCIRPCSIVFGADQLVKKDDPKSAERVDKYFNWYYASVSFSAVVALSVVVYIQDHFGMKVGLGVPAILMLLALLLFLFGAPLYVKTKAHKSLFPGYANVLVAAFRNRHLLIPPGNSELLHYHRKNSNCVSIPSEKLRFLNKACIVKNLEEDVDHKDPTAELCSVDQVEELKTLINIIPIWSTGIMIYLNLCQISLSVLQAKSMNKHVTSSFQIPAGSFGLFTAISLLIWVVLYTHVVIPLVRKYTGRSSGILPIHRIGIGLILSCLAMLVAATVESIRRKTAIQQGFSDHPESIVNMSAMWLIPQFSLTGLAEAFNAVGQIEFYYSELPKSMSSTASALFTLGASIAALLSSLLINIVNNVTAKGGKVSWLSTNLNKGHYDYYYGLLSFLNVLNFVYFLVCYRVYGPRKDDRGNLSDEAEDLKEGLLSKSREFPNTSSAWVH